jgi:hypothetical protein
MVTDILALAASGGTSIADVLIFAGVPILIAVVAGVWALVKGLLRFTQFMAHSETTSRSVADSNIEIRDKIEETNNQLAVFAKETNTRLGAHDQALAVLNFVLNRNGDIAARVAAQADQHATDTTERIRQEKEDPPSPMVL